MKLKWRGLQFEHYILGILLAVEWIMSFTFLGYIHIPPISITTAHIPIVVIACLFGPVESSVAGLFFGLGCIKHPHCMLCWVTEYFLHFRQIFR